jgi:hypothetical protein
MAVTSVKSCIDRSIVVGVIQSESALPPDFFQATYYVRIWYVVTLYNTHSVISYRIRKVWIHSPSRMQPIEAAAPPKEEKTSILSAGASPVFPIGIRW